MSSGRGSSFERSRWPTSGCGPWIRYPVKLRAHELVVRQIIVEGVDDPIAPIVNAGRGGHALVGVGVAQHVEPVAGITDAVLLAGEQFVDHLFVGIGRFVFEKGLLFGG